MAQNDFFTIAYKILEYLYRCMQNGVSPRYDDYNCTSELLGDIPEAYWCNVMRILIENGYIDGAWVVSIARQTHPGIKTSGQTSITLKGIEYLQDNSKMQQAKKIFGKATEILISAIINAMA